VPHLGTLIANGRYHVPGKLVIHFHRIVVVGDGLGVLRKTSYPCYPSQRKVIAVESRDRVGISRVIEERVDAVAHSVHNFRTSTGWICCVRVRASEIRADSVGWVTRAVRQNDNFVLLVVDAEPPRRTALLFVYGSTHAKPSCGPQLFLSDDWRLPRTRTFSPVSGSEPLPNCTVSRLFSFEVNPPKYDRRRPRLMVRVGRIL